MTTPKIKSKVNTGVKIVLDKERTLKLDLNAMVAFEEATGKSLAGGAFKSKDMTLRDYRVLTWACLIHEDETLIERQVGAYVTVGNMKEITSKLNEAFEVAMFESEGKKTYPLAKETPRG